MDKDKDIFEAQMRSPITEEDNRQEYHSVDITPENSFLPRTVNKSIIKSNIENIEKGLNLNLNKVVETT